MTTTVDCNVAERRGLRSRTVPKARECTVRAAGVKRATTTVDYNAVEGRGSLSRREWTVRTARVKRVTTMVD